MKQILAHSGSYTKGRTRAIDHIIVHYTAGDGDTAENNGDYFAAGNRKTSAHYFVDETEIVQSVLEEDTAWHAGDWEMNSRSVGVEMCSKKDAAGEYYIPTQTLSRAKYLVRQLMDKYEIPVSQVLRHYDVTGKRCPAPMVENEALWEAFTQGLAGFDEPSQWAKEASLWAVEENLIQGDENGFFRWQDAVTRQELAVILQRFAKK